MALVDAGHASSDLGGVVPDYAPEPLSGGFTRDDEVV